MRNIGISVVENFCLELKENFSLASVWDDSHFFLTSHFHLASPSIHLTLTALFAASSPSPASSPSRLLLETCCSAAPSRPRLTFRALSSPSSSSLASTLAGCNLAADNAGPGMWPRPTLPRFVRPHLCSCWKSWEEHRVLISQTQIQNCHSDGEGIGSSPLVKEHFGPESNLHAASSLFLGDSFFIFVCSTDTKGV